MWQILASEYLFKETWFTIRKDRCKTEEGKIIDPYYVYEFPTWVTALPMTENGEVLLIKQYRHGIQQTIIEIPGGCVDNTDPDLESAIRREILEETGYAFSSYDYLGKISPNPSTNDNWMHMFLAQGGKKVQEVALDHNEDIEVVLVSLEELQRMIMNNEIIQSLHISTMMYGMMKLGALQFSNKENTSTYQDKIV